MKNKVIFSFTIILLLCLSIILTNSYVQALSEQGRFEIKKELLQQQVNDNKENFSQIYKNLENKTANYNNCKQNEDCLMYQQDYNCEQNENCSMYQQNYNCEQNENCPMYQQDYNCEQNENCPMYQQNYNCIVNNNPYSQKRYDCKKNCNQKMYSINR